MKPVNRSAPAGARIINDQELERLVWEVVNSIPKDTEGTVSVSFEEVESNLYEMVSPKLNSNRVYYPGLNPRVLSRALRSISSSFNFKSTKVSESGGIWKAYDELVWRKINELPYDAVKLESLKRALRIE